MINKKKIALFLMLLLCLSHVGAFASTVYDELENLFLSIGFSTSYENAKQMIVETGLPYTEKVYNGSAKIGKTVSLRVAFIEEAARQSYAKSGEHLIISFQKDTGKLLSMEFVPQRLGISALMYSFGSWFEFREDEANNTYSGYYVIKHTDQKKNGIRIQYKNGYSTKTNYYRYDDKQFVLDLVN